MVPAKGDSHPTAFLNHISQERIMMFSRSLMRRAWAPLVLAVAMPLAAHAQERVLGTWNGRVDKEMQITIHGNRASSNTISGEQFNGRFRLASALPREDGTVRVAVSRGRGEVSVVQQPSASNDYTAIIRLLDRGSGADAYRVTTYWTPAYARQGNRGMNGRDRVGVGNGVGMGRGNRGRNGMNNGAVLRWSGDVDADAEIRWGANGVNQRNIGGAALRGTRSSQSGSAVYRGGTVSVAQRAGRGSVAVVQQPTAANGWKAVIRVHDPQPGYGHYDLDVTWQ
jgi:hypothetical protein